MRALFTTIALICATPLFSAPPPDEERNPPQVTQGEKAVKILEDISLDYQCKEARIFDALMLLLGDQKIKNIKNIETLILIESPSKRESIYHRAKRGDVRVTVDVKNKNVMEILSTIMTLSCGMWHFAVIDEGIVIRDYPKSHAYDARSPEEKERDEKDPFGF